MKKKLFLLLCFILLTATLVGCSGEGAKTDTAWDLNTITTRLLNEISYTDSLSEMSPDLMDYLFPDVNPSDVADQYIYISTGSTAEELAIFRAVDAAAAERIEAGLIARIEMQTESFTDYVPFEVKRLEDAVLKRKGDCVVLSVSGEPDKAKEILK